MAENKWSEAHIRATKKYEAKTYKKLLIRLRKIEDSELIDFIEEQSNKGVSNNQLLVQALKEYYNNHRK